MSYTLHGQLLDIHENPVSGALINQNTRSGNHDANTLFINTDENGFFSLEINESKDYKRSITTSIEFDFIEKFVFYKKEELQIFKLTKELPALRQSKENKADTAHNAAVLTPYATEKKQKDWQTIALWALLIIVLLVVIFILYTVFTSDGNTVKISSPNRPVERAAPKAPVAAQTPVAKVAAPSAQIQCKPYSSPIQIPI